MSKQKKNTPQKINLTNEVLNYIRDIEVQVITQKKELLEEELSQCQCQITQLNRRITEQARIMKRKIDDFESLEFSWEKFLSDIVSNDFYTFIGLDESNTCFSFVTKPVTLIYHRGEDEIRLPMGQYKARWWPALLKISLIGHNENITCYGRISPFVDKGEICWGNAASTIARLLAENKIAEVFSHLQTLLTTYSPESNPYVSIESFESRGTINGIYWKDYFNQKLKEVLNGKEEQKQRVVGESYEGEFQDNFREQEEEEQRSEDYEEPGDDF